MTLAGFNIGSGHLGKACTHTGIGYTPSVLGAVMLQWHLLMYWYTALLQSAVPK